MSRKGPMLPWLVLAGLALAGVSMTPADRPPVGPGGAKAPRSAPKHYVSPRQLAGSNAMIRSAVEVPEAVARLGGGRPLVLVFVKEGCPCNAEFEPFLRRVERLYSDSARFAGVIDAGPESARKYAEELRVDHPVLADPDRRIIGRFRAENGGYIALLTPDGAIEGFWPGCSADGMRDLGHRIARLAGVAERPLDVDGMPGPLTTGCPFGPEIEQTEDDSDA